MKRIKLQLNRPNIKPMAQIGGLLVVLILSTFVWMTPVQAQAPATNFSNVITNSVNQIGSWFNDLSQDIRNIFVPKSATVYIPYPVFQYQPATGTPGKMVVNSNVVNKKTTTVKAKTGSSNTASVTQPSTFITNNYFSTNNVGLNGYGDNILGGTLSFASGTIIDFSNTHVFNWPHTYGGGGSITNVTNNYTSAETDPWFMLASSSLSYLKVESDPLWSLASTTLTVANFATSSISQWVNDAGYLTSIGAETDPVFMSASSSLPYLKVESDPYFMAASTSLAYLKVETDPYWSAVSTTVPYLASQNTFTATNTIANLIVNGKIGIGTVNPEQNLQVVGNIYATGDLMLYPGAKIAFDKYDTNRSSIRTSGVATADMLFQTNGGSRMYISNTGYVGIGTTTPNANLNIFGTTNTLLRVATSSNQNIFIIDSNGNVGINELSPTAKLDIANALNNVPTATNQSLMFSRDDGVPYYGMMLDSSSRLKFTARAGSDWITALSMDQFTNIGIGTTTSAVSSRLTVQALPGASAFSVASSTGASLLYIAANGNVGIGTNNPDADKTLTVIGQGRFSSSLTVNANFSSGGYVAAGTDLYVARNSYLTGLVGIGTSTPVYNLDVFANANTQKGISVTNASTGTSAQARVDLYNNLGSVQSGNGASLFLTSSNYSPSSYANALGFWNYQNGPVIIAANNTEAMRVTATGNVGIGTSNPSGKFEVFDSNDVGMSSSAFKVDTVNHVIYLGRLSTTVGSSDDIIMQNRVGTKIMEFRNSNGIVNIGEQGSSGNTAPINFYLSGNVKATILQNGNFGIGTSSPSATLHVNGQLNTEGNVNLLPTGAAGSSVGIYFNQSRSSLSYDGVLNGTNLNIGTRLFDINASSISRLRIDATGNIGIGTTTPNAKLVVQGTSTTPLLSINTSSTGSALFVDASGNVGVGTAVPAYPLDVNGNTRIWGVLTLLNGTSYGIIAGNAKLNLYDNAGNASYQNTYPGWGFGVGNISPTYTLDVKGNGAVGGMFNVASSTGVSALMVSNSGYVGIGTSTPSSPLHVYDIRSGGGLVSLRTQGTVTGQNWSGAIAAGGQNVAFLMGEYNGMAWLGANNPNLSSWSDFYINPDGTKKLYLGSKGGYSGGVAMTVDNSTGNVGIGTTTPADKLTIDGGSANLRFSGSGTHNIQSTAGLIIINNLNQLTFNNGNYIKQNYPVDFANTFFGGTSSNLPIMTWSDTGLVGINSTTPTSNLSVKATAGINPLNVTSSTNSSMLMVASNGRVGINTTAPVAGFDLTVGSNDYIRMFDSFTNGTNSTGNVLVVKSSNNSAPLLTLTGTGNADLMNLYSSSSVRVLTVSNSGYMGIGTTTLSSTVNIQAASGMSALNVASSSGSTMLTVASNGNVGIGVSNPNYKLAVNGSLVAGNSSDGLYVNPGTYGVNLTGLDILGNAFNGVGISTRVADNPDFYVATTGNVGIGTTTPNSTLHIVAQGGVVPFTVASSSGMAMVAINKTGTMIIGSTYANSANYYSYGDGFLLMQSNIGFIGTTAHYLQNVSNSDVGIKIWNGSTDVIPMTAHSSGNVEFMAGNIGIGTSSPQTKLDVWGNMQVGTAATPSLFVDSATGYVGIGTNGGSATYKLDVSGNLRTQGYLYNSTKTLSPIFAEGSGERNGMWLSFPNSTTELRASDGTSTARIRLDGATGNVGIGTTTPNAKLSVDGNAFIGGSLTTTGNLTIPAWGGANSAPSLVIGSDPTYGLLRVNGNASVAVIAASTIAAQFTNVGIQAAGYGIQNYTNPRLGGLNLTNGSVAWGPSTSMDVNISRIATNTIAVGTAADQSTGGTLIVGSIGIGTSTPSQLLTVGNNNQFTVTAGGTVNIANGTSYNIGGYTIYGNVGGAAYVPTVYSYGNFQTTNTGYYGFSADATAYHSADAGISRGGSGKLYIGNGTVGDYTGAMIAGSIGIGTSTPQATLTVQSSSSAMVISVVSSSGTSLFTVLQNGNVGIGTASPETNLEVSGNASVFNLRGTATGGPYMTFYNNTAVRGFVGVPYQIFGSSGVSDGLGIRANNIQFGHGLGLIDMTINSSGYIGIGTTTPDANLGIFGATSTLLRVATSTNQNIFVINGSGNVNMSGALSIGTTSVASMLNIQSAVGVSPFSITSSTGSSTLYVAPNGFVGIGSTNPLSRLTVGPTPGLSTKLLTVSDMATPYSKALANGIALSLSGGGGIYMNSGGSGGVDGKYEVYAGALGIGTMSTHPIQFFTSDAVRMFISTAGLVGVGTQSPIYKLDVKGTAAADGVRSDIGFDIYPVPDPATLTGAVGAGGTVDDGAHWYGVTYITALGETHVKYTTAQITTGAGNNTVTLTLPVSTDPRVTGRKIYRTKVSGNQYEEYYLATVASTTQTTYVDTNSDASLAGLPGVVYFKPNTTSKQLTVSGSTVMMADDRATYFGVGAGANVTTGGRNTFFGRTAGYMVASGTDNQFFGYSAGYNTNSGSANVSLGYQALYSNTTGGSNIAIGQNASLYNVTGSSNVAIGAQALFGVSGYSTWNNIAIGTGSAASHAAGDQNVFLGTNAGRYLNDGVTVLASTSNSIYLGYNAKGLSNSDNNSIVIGYNANGIGANSVVLGNDSITTTTLKGFVGIGTVSPLNKLDVWGGAVAIQPAGYDSPVWKLNRFDGAAMFEWDMSGGTNGDLQLFRGDPWGLQTAMYVNRTSGNIGFGSSSPSAVLTVKGYFRNNSDLLDVASSSGVSALRITSAGNVGIGTTTPLAKLHVSGGNGTAILMDNNKYLSGLSTTGAVMGVLGIGPNNAVRIGGFDPGNGSASAATNFNASSINVMTLTSAGVVIQPSGVQTGATNPFEIYPTSGSFIVNSTGYVGIGTTTPALKLHIYGSADAAIAVQDSRAGGKFATLGAGTAGTGFQFDKSGYFTIYGANTLTDSGASATNYLKVYGSTGNILIGNNSYNTADSNFKMNITDAGSNGYLAISSSTAGNILVVNSLGNVGIGTSSPSELLNAYSGTGSAKILLQAPNGSALVRLQGVLSSDWQFGTEVATGDFLIRDQAGLANPFYIQKGAPANSFYIKNNGNVGIGIANPAQLLDVEGRIRANAIEMGSNNSYLGYLDQGGLVFNTSIASSIYNAYTGANLFLASNNGNVILGMRDDGLASYNGKVAIGTSSPWAKLSVQNTFGSNLPLLDIATTTSASNSTSSIFYVGANGNVGIGTSSPGYTFEVAGSMYVNDSGGFGIGSASFAGKNRLFTNGGELRYLTTGNGYGNIQVGGAIFNGNVGIGTTTQQATLTVQGSTSAMALNVASSTGLSMLSVATNGYIGMGTINPLGAIDVYSASSSYYFGRGATDGQTPELRIYGDPLTYSTLRYGSMYIDPYGKLAFGGTAYGTLFKTRLETDAGLALPSSGRYILNHSEYQTHGFASGYSMYLQLGSFDGVTYGQSSELIIGKTNTYNHQTPYTTNPTLYIFSSSTSVDQYLKFEHTTDRGSITSGKNWIDFGSSMLTTNGAIGIGTTTPSARLQIAGIAGATDLLAITSSTNSRMLTLSSDGNLTINALNVNGAVYSNNGVLTNVNPSSENYKNSIAETNLNTEALLGLKVKSYNWNNNGQADFGLIAEDVKSALPELYMESNGTKGYRSDHLPFYLLQIAQKQNQELKVLSQQISSFNSSTPLAVTDSSNNNFSTLSVQSSAVFYGTITVKGVAGFESKVVFKNEVEFQDHITVDSDTAGGTIITVGATSTIVSFNRPYNSIPRISVNLLSSGTPAFVPYLIADKTTSSFSIILNGPAPTDLYFDWMALAVRGQVAGVSETRIPGCMDSNATNYNAQATQSDNSCTYATSTETIVIPIITETVVETPPPTEPVVDTLVVPETPPAEVTPVVEPVIPVVEP